MVRIADRAPESRVERQAPAPVHHPQPVVRVVEVGGPLAEGRGLDVLVPGVVTGSIQTVGRARHAVLREEHLVARRVEEVLIGLDPRRLLEPVRRRGRSDQKS